MTDTQTKNLYCALAALSQPATFPADVELAKNAIRAALDEGTPTKLQLVADSYRRMPNGGAILTLHNADHFAHSARTDCANKVCAVSNGHAIIERFENMTVAETALRVAGFAPSSNGTWRLA